MTDLYPLLFQADFRDKPWGSSRLHDVLKKDVSPERPVGESWEVWSGSVVANGPWAGRTVDQIIAEHWDEVMGRQLADATPLTFPLLFKFIDANEWLSVQVHPDDAYAQKHEGVPFGKTEAWYIVHADPGAQIIYGWNKDLSREQVADAIKNDTIKDDLSFSVVRTGDVVTVPAGTVHALGSGLVIAEIQENSDVTYRLYDWGRVGLDGNPRELHVEQSLDTSFYEKAAGQFLNADEVEAKDGERRMAACRYFVIDVLDVEGSKTLQLNGDRFVILATLSGNVTVSASGGDVTLPAGASALLPAALGATTISAPDGARLIALAVPRADELAAISDPLRVF